MPRFGRKNDKVIELTQDDMEALLATRVEGYNELARIQKQGTFMIDSETKEAINWDYQNSRAEFRNLFSEQEATYDIQICTEVRRIIIRKWDVKSADEQHQKTYDEADRQKQGLDAKLQIIKETCPVLADPDRSFEEYKAAATRLEKNGVPINYPLNPSQLLESLGRLRDIVNDIERIAMKYSDEQEQSRAQRDLVERLGGLEIGLSSAVDRFAYMKDYEGTYTGPLSPDIVAMVLAGGLPEQPTQVIPANGAQ